VAEAIEELSGLSAGIKWVNDVLVAGKKVSGILTEASVDCESGMMNYVIIGIGINTRVPAGDFPAELREIAGAVFGEAPVPELRCRLAAAVLDKLWGYYEHFDDCSYYSKYRERSLVLGKDINILARGRDPEPAFALDIAPDFSLLVRTEDGAVRRLNSGEVSIRVK
jgi:BirA family biotin operon repressor/biotin-[acetyl-CoA-carboxylase] ligase